MGSGLQELLSWPVELIQRGGKPAGAVAIAAGLLLIPAGLWLTFGWLGEGRYWPIMLTVSVLGLGLGLTGLAAFVGVDARLATFDPNRGLPDELGPSGAIETAVIPFWVCGQCKIVRDSISSVARCDQCGSVIDYMAVECEADRKLATGLLG